MTAAVHPFEPVVVDVVFRPDPGAAPEMSACSASKELAAARLQQIQRQRAIAAAEEAAFILRFAQLCPVDDDPPPDHPGAKSRGWTPREDRPGVSEFFLDELAMVLNVGRGTASFRARRAFTWRDQLPATFAALQRGEIDERRAQELFIVCEHVPTPLAQRIDAVLIHEASQLSVTKLGARARALLLELDAAAAEDRCREARTSSDVFLQPVADGLATIGADLPADEAAEAYDLIDQLATMAKADGDERPIRQIRTEIYSLLLRSPGALAGVRANLTITASLASLDGSSSAPAEVNGCVITPAQLRDLLARIDALGLHTPDDGTLTIAILGADGRLLATAGHSELERRVRRGDGLDPPPPTDAYAPTDAQRRFVTTRDRVCRFPNCGQRVGWADHDHVIPHACGGDTDCANLCCLCRSHHRLKTFARGWTFVMEPDGTLRVTTPSGITRVTRPPGLRPPPTGGDGHSGQPDPGSPVAGADDELPPF